MKIDDLFDIILSFDGRDFNNFSIEITKQQLENLVVEIKDYKAQKEFVRQGNELTDYVFGILRKSVK